MSGRHQLAPNAKCAVCNDDASGFHYGVDSCEGCKGFFRRCITQGINFRCSNEEKCQITPFTRNSCQYCRLKKCFQVGMSREASRLGRRPKKVMKSTSLSRDFQAQLTKHMDTKPRSSNSSSPGIDCPDLANAALSDMFGFPADMMSNFSKMMPSMASGIGSPPGMPGTGSSGMPPSFMFPGMMPPGHESGSMMPPGNMNMPTLPNNNDRSPSQPMSDHTKMPPDQVQVTHMDLNKWREKQFEVMSKYMHNKDASSAGDQSASESSSIELMASRDSESKDSSPLSLESQISPITGSPPNGNHMMSIQMQTDTEITIMSDSQKQRISRFISYISPHMSDDILQLISEVQKGIAESHLEHCYHQRPRIYAVSAELDAKELSGEDIRPPNGFWSHWMSELLPTIERVVRFLKDIPGFRELPINDQILLIKKGAFDIVLSQVMPMVDSEKLSILDPTLKYRNTRKDFECMPMGFRKLFDDHFILSNEFKMVGVTDMETGLINAILGVNSGVHGFENAKAVEKLECLFVQTLYDYVIKNYPDKPGRFESLIRLIPLVDNTSQAHANSLQKIKCNVPQTDQLFPPLHHEIFS